nr:hypothetical protein [Tanacetum cinerariifolium]
MSTLKFAETHNMITFLSKPTESEGFEQIVDFMNANPIKYALTVNPTIYTPCIEQFWDSVKKKTINGEEQLQALVDKKKVFGNMKRVGKGFSGRETPLFPAMMVQAQEDMGEGSTHPTDPHHTPTIMRTEDVNESVELKRCLEIVPDDGNDVTIDATRLSSKYLTIVDYKIYKERRKIFFQIIRADGNSRMYLTFSKMLKNFDREDLETMFEHHVEDNMWMNQQGLVSEESKLYDSCGIHCVTMLNTLYYLLVEKMYPLTHHTLHQMFNDVKLQVDYKCEMAYELLRLVRKKLREGYVAE